MSVVGARCFQGRFAIKAIDAVLSAIAAWIITVISAGGYLGIFGLMAIESACIPLPSEVIMPFEGYLASTGRLDLWLVATAGALGCNFGSVLAYEAGRHGGRRFVERYGRWLLLTSQDIDRAERFFLKYGGAAVFIGRMLPGVRSFIALPAGIARMPLIRFHIYTFAGSWPWCFALAYVGMTLGRKWNSDPRLSMLFHKFDAAMLLIFLAGSAWFVWHRLRGGRT